MIIGHLYGQTTWMNADATKQRLITNLAQEFATLARENKLSSVGFPNASDSFRTIRFCLMRKPLEKLKNCFCRHDRCKNTRLNWQSLISIRIFKSLTRNY